MDDVVREGSAGRDLSRDLGEVREESEPRPGEGAFRQTGEPEQGPCWTGSACWRTGREARVGEWSEPVVMAGCEVGQDRRPDSAGILAVVRTLEGGHQESNDLICF